MHLPLANLGILQDLFYGHLRLFEVVHAQFFEPGPSQCTRVVLAFMEGVYLDRGLSSIGKSPLRSLTLSVQSPHASLILPHIDPSLPLKVSRTKLYHFVIKVLEFCAADF